MHVWDSEGTSFGGPLLTVAFQVHLVIKVESHPFMFGLITPSSSSRCYHRLQSLLHGPPAPGGVVHLSENNDMNKKSG